MINTIILVLFAIATSAASFYFHRNVRVFAWGLVVELVAVGLVAFFGIFGNTIDTEILNGEVVGKYQDKVSCGHSYQCNCRQVTTCSGSGKDRHCSTSQQCDTCYEHPYDFDWVVQSSIPSKLLIDRVDRQGVSEPPRFTAVKIGQPFAETHTHLNYLKDASTSLYYKSGDYRYANLIPPYPINVYDLYNINRALSAGVQVPDLAEWSSDISNALRQLGPQKQANLIILFVATDDPSYEYALATSWKGGHKNDIIVVFGVTEYPKINFTRILSWTDSAEFKIKLRDRLDDIGTIDERAKIMSAIVDETKKTFVRKRMRDFEYLIWSKEIPMEWNIFCLIGLVACGILCAGFNRRDNFVGYRQYFKKKY